MTLKTELDIEAVAKEYANAYLEATKQDMAYMSMNGLRRFIAMRMTATCSYAEIDAVEAAATAIIWPAS